MSAQDAGFGRDIFDDAAGRRRLQPAFDRTPDVPSDGLLGRGGIDHGAARRFFRGDAGYVPLVSSAGTIRVMLPRNGSERLLAKIVYTGPVPAPVVKGQVIGKLKVWRGDNLALEVPLQAADDVGPGTMPQRAVDGATELMIGLLRAGVNKL